MRRNILALEGKNTATDTDTEIDAQKFYLHDEHRRMCAGKKDTVTRNKIKQQKRYLTDSIQNLHEKFSGRFPEYKISYSQFEKQRNLSVHFLCEYVRISVTRETWNVSIDLVKLVNIKR